MIGALLKTIFWSGVWIGLWAVLGVLILLIIPVAVLYEIGRTVKKVFV